MFSAKTVLDAFKSMETADAPANLSHTQYLEHNARRLGFKSWNNLKPQLEKAHIDRIGDVRTGLMRKICGTRRPSQESIYLRMTSYDDLSYGFESYFIGWDKHGDEVRVPRPNYDKQAVTDFRSRYDVPLYVIETNSEFFAWRYGWRAEAVLPEALARVHFISIFNRQHLVEENPPMDEVRRKYQEQQKRYGRF